MSKLQPLQKGELIDLVVTHLNGTTRTYSAKVVALSDEHYVTVSYQNEKGVVVTDTAVPKDAGEVDRELFPYYIRHGASKKSVKAKTKAQEISAIVTRPAKRQRAAKPEKAKPSASTISKDELLRVADRVAKEIARRRGHVTSTDVWDRLYARGLVDDTTNDRFDPRWMGAIFGAKRGWTRLRYASTGSHKRPVSVWALV